MLSRLLILLCIFTSCPSYAGLRINDLSTGTNNIDFNNWTGLGNATINVDFCVTSVLGNIQQSTTTAPYEIKLRTRGGNASASIPFQLEPSSGAGQAIPMTVTYSDLIANSSEQLGVNIYTAQDKTGAIIQCPSGLNARLRFTINQADLVSSAAGSYRSLLRITARGGESGTEIATRNISLNINIDDIVQLQGLDDLLLGNYGGSGRVSARESFCVYRNGSDTYQVTARGNGDGGAFTLLNNDDEIPYSLEWDDSSVVTPMSANNNLTQRQNASVNICSSGTSNASINITLQESDLTASPAGNYRGTLTLIIAPE